jgi:hypothetical protein
LVINCNTTDEGLKTFPQTQELPKLSGRFIKLDRKGQARCRLLKAQLRLSHLKEGEQEIRQICTEYADVFKLPGDRLTATSAIEQCIPTPTIPPTEQLHYVITEFPSTIRKK